MHLALWAQGPRGRLYLRDSIPGSPRWTKRPELALLYKSSDAGEPWLDVIASFLTEGIELRIDSLDFGEMPLEEVDELVGDIIWSAAATRDHCLSANGQAVSRSLYADLFAAIGTVFGTGDGSTTFNVPDLSGRVSVGRETSETRITNAVSGFSGATLGAAGGSQSHTLVTAEMPAHTHTMGLQTSLTVGSGGNQRVITGAALSTGSAGGDGAHRNVQPSLVLNAFIRY